MEKVNGSDQNNRFLLFLRITADLSSIFHFLSLNPNPTVKPPPKTSISFGGQQYPFSFPLPPASKRPLLSLLPSSMASISRFLHKASTFNARPGLCQISMRQANLGLCCYLFPSHLVGFVLELLFYQNSVVLFLLFNENR